MIILIAVIIILFIILALWRLDLAVIATIGLLPTYLVRFSVGPVPFTLLEALVLIVALVFFFRFRLYRLAYLKQAIDKVPFKFPLLLLFAAATLAVLVSPNLRGALGEWRAYFVEAIIFYIVFVNVIVWRRHIKYVLYALGISALVVSVYAIIQHFTGINIPAPWHAADLRRVTAWYEYPVAVALYLAPIVGLFIAQLFFRRHSKIIVAWPFALAVVAAGVLAVYYTHSRGALVAILITLAVLSFFTKYRWYIVSIIVIAVLILAFIPGVSDRFVDVFTGDDNSTNVRLVMWKGTLKMLKDNWFLGAGLSGFQSLYDVYREARHTELLLYPHSLFLNFWVELGLIGLAAFVWLLVAYFRRVKRALKSNMDRAVLFGSLAAMLVLLIHGLIDVPYFKNDLAILFLVIIGIFTAGYELSKNKNSAQPS
ncbi:O-antigen ligase family protein [Patescibacteria group bacterium]